jgi:hypothetical protein
MPALVAGIHVGTFLKGFRKKHRGPSWMPGTSPGVTETET